MKLATTSGAARLLRACDPRWVYDYDAPGLSIEARLHRLHLALEMARRRCADPQDEAEISYALQDCIALMAAPKGGHGAVRRESVHKRMARMKRVLAYHEGTVDRLNRRYWWIPFTLILTLILSRVGPELLSLFI